MGMLPHTAFGDLEEAKFTAKDKASYARPTSIHHWQLRDLISPADNEHQFYCVHEEAVYCYNAKARQSSIISNLDFSPNSMTCSMGFIAAGGTHGELEVRDLSRDNSVCFKGAVGSTVNNALHIAAHSSGEVRLFVCCNDNTIKVFRLPDMQSITTIRCPCPINYTALSPDANTLVAVGDCHPTYVYHTTPTGYRLFTSFTAAQDVGMCCAWNTHGTLFSSCHQDGSVAVWDHRSGACVAHFNLPTAARCVKFSAAPLDLLAVSEHESAVTLVDARHWGSRQVLQLDSNSSSGGVLGSRRSSRCQDVSGIAFTPSGQRLWVGTEGCCMSYDIDTVKRRTFSVADIL